METSSVNSFTVSGLRNSQIKVCLHYFHNKMGVKKKRERRNLYSFLVQTSKSSILSKEGDIICTSSLKNTESQSYEITQCDWSTPSVWSNTRNNDPQLHTHAHTHPQHILNLRTIELSWHQDALCNTYTYRWQMKLKHWKNFGKTSQLLSIKYSNYAALKLLFYYCVKNNCYQTIWGTLWFCLKRGGGIFIRVIQHFSPPVPAW